MTDAEKLVERVRVALTEVDPRCEAVPEEATHVLRAVVEELEIERRMVDKLASVEVRGAVKKIGTPDLGDARDSCTDALATLLEAAGADTGDFANRPGKIAVFSEDQNFDMEGVDDD